MKSFFAFILALTLAFPTTAFPAVFPGGPTVTVGGQLLPNPSQSVTLIVSVGNSNKYGTLRQLNGTSGYIVPGGKTLRISMTQCQMTPVVATALTIGYGDNDVGFLSASAPTNAVYIAGTSSVFLYTATALFSFAFGQGFTAPTGKYPFVATDGASTSVSCLVYGTLE